MTGLANYSGGGQYEAARRGVNDSYAAQSSANTYGRFLSQQRGKRELGDMSRNFQRSYPGYRASFAQRGMGGPGVTSGVQQQSMADYLGDYYRDYGRTEQDITQGLQQYDLSQTQLDAWRNSELMNIEMQRAADIANTAAQLEALRGYLGGL